MKLRLRSGSLRLRVNQQEVAALAAGGSLRDSISFPAGTALTYVFEPDPQGRANVTFDGERIRVTAAQLTLREWAHGDEIGIYFDAGPLKVSIEKDLECVDGPEHERDPHAYPRAVKAC